MKSGFKALDRVRGPGASRFESGASNSWLEATPTIFMHHIALYVPINKDMWERHLAAIFEYFGSNHHAAIGLEMRF
jgi:hypothetical protein